MPGTPEEQTDTFRADVLAGLSAAVPAVPSRWLYDQVGSELFDAITRLPEYSLTRTETTLLGTVTEDLSRLLPNDCAIIEFGAGSATKTPILIEAAKPAAYVPVDISGDYLQESAAAVSAGFTDVEVVPVVADFTTPFELPEVVQALPKVGFFPGSTIGNFVPASATDLLRHFRVLLGTGAWLLIGMDRVKPVARLLAAYDDAAGVTARFNLNLLQRVNRELEGTVPVEAFRHEARWNEVHARIEMHLVAKRHVEFTVSGQSFTLTEGQSIHTENSHKYGTQDARLLLLTGGWTPRLEWSDPAGDLTLILCEAAPGRLAP